jgi:TolB-like protein/class 3 adenylate cyclase
LAREQRRLAAIVAADVVGYSRLMGRDESGTVARLKQNRAERLDPILAKYGGRLVKLTGDGALVEFTSAVDALSAMIEFQQAMVEANHRQSPDTALVFRMGLHLGDLIVDGDDLYGDGVNVAARLEAEASAGGIVISGDVHNAVAGKLKATFDDLGVLSLKNIGRPVQAFNVRWEAADWKILAPSAAVPSPAATFQSTDAPLTLPEKPSLAVLPFQNMSGNPEQEYFADGMVEDIITALSRFKSLFVIARNSSFAYKGKSPDIRQVGRELGVRYVLEGSVRKAGDRVRLTGQLIDATTGVHIWADRFESTLEDVFELQDRMTGSVVAAIEPKLRMAEIERALRKPTENLQAYDLMLRALPKLRQLARESLEEAIRLLRRAIAIDPEYAVAMVQLAAAQWHLLGQGWLDRSDPELTDMVQLARTALELDGDDSEVLAAVAFLIAFPGNDFSGGMALIEKAIGLNPNSANALRQAGSLHAYAGDTRAALDRQMQADRLNPLEGGLSHRLGYALAYFVAGEYESVIEWTGTILRDRPNFMPALRYRAASFGLLNRLDEGRQVVRQILELVPSFTIAWVRKHIELDMNNAFKKPGVADALYEGLRRSGAPEA